MHLNANHWACTVADMRDSDAAFFNSLQTEENDLQLIFEVVLFVKKEVCYICSIALYFTVV